MNSQMVRISPKAKRVYLQRFLLSKFVYFQEELTLEDICCLFENQLWLEDKCLSDPEFASKFGQDLESLSVQMKQINFRKEITPKAIHQFSERIRNIIPDLILPRRNYSEAKRKCNGLFELKDSKSIGILTKLLPPKRYVGIGYRDKGSAKNKAEDGSPSWQEVATHRGPIYHKGKEIENENSTDRRDRTIAEKLVRVCTELSLRRSLE